MSDERDGEPETPLDVGGLLSLLSKAHMLDLIAVIVLKREPPIRFNELQVHLDLSPNTLSRHLEKLVDVGFLERRSYDEIPPRVEYEPTEKLYALEPTFRELEAWIDRYGDDEEFALPDEPVQSVALEQSGATDGDPDEQ